VLTGEEAAPMEGGEAEDHHIELAGNEAAGVARGVVQRGTSPDRSEVDELVPSWAAAIVYVTVAQ
jgi:hypothetical protein